MTDGATDSLPKRVYRWALYRVFAPSAAIHLARLTRASGKRAIAYRLAQPDSPVRRILVICLDNIGDVVLTSGFLRELRGNFVNSHITLVVRHDITNLVERCPYVDEIVPFPGTPGKFWSPLTTGAAVTIGLRRLAPRGIDLAIVPRWDVDPFNRAALLAFFSEANRRVAFSERVNGVKAICNKGADRLFTETLFDPEIRHEVEHYFDLLRFLGCRVSSTRLELWLDAADRRYATRLIRSTAVGEGRGRPLVALGLGAGKPNRMWPAESYAALCQRLVRSHDCRIVLLGGSDAAAAARLIRQRVGGRTIDLTGRLTLRQAAAVIEACRLYVGNDSGLMHLAAAAGLPVVELSCHPATGQPGSPNSPLRFGPWGVPHVILQPSRALPPCTTACAADHPHCIRLVPLDAVAEAVARLLAGAEACRESPAALPSVQ